MEQVRNFIDLVGQGNNTDAKDILDELLSARAFEALEAKKQEIGATMFGGEEVTTEEPTEEPAAE
jgi:hypothetical protein